MANEKLRARVKHFQSETFDDLSFQEIDDFLDSLMEIETKLPYFVNLQRILLKKKFEFIFFV